MQSNWWLTHPDWLHALIHGCHDLTGHPDPWRRPFKSLRIFCFILSAQRALVADAPLVPQAEAAYDRLLADCELDGQKAPFSLAGTAIFTTQTSTAHATQRVHY